METGLIKFQRKLLTEVMFVFVASQEEVTVKRIKLEYDELSKSVKEQAIIWDYFTIKDNKMSAKCDGQALIQAVRQGIGKC